ncbi:hypothetical protein NDU88_004437 [Pleurodeles waltl]|uniref:Uncharacterized protein n=1 Tax=Pleurodeles waltl TaxID=8319 RepID=A0AAV7KYE1_PLEWA|nr:hypothetical protein NDU88_004437 [Pleurodeles waltl]
MHRRRAVETFDTTSGKIVAPPASRLKSTLTCNVTKESTPADGETMRSIADGGWETAPCGYVVFGSSCGRISDMNHCMHGKITQRPAWTPVRTESTHRSPADRRTDARRLDRRGKRCKVSLTSDIDTSQATFDAHPPVQGYF